MDIVAERLQGGNVKDFRAIRQFALPRFGYEGIYSSKKGGEGLSGAGGSGDQNIASGLDFRPTLPLRLGDRSEVRGKPLSDERIERGQNIPVRQHLLIISAEADGSGKATKLLQR